MRPARCQSTTVASSASRQQALHLRQLTRAMSASRRAKSWSPYTSVRRSGQPVVARVLQEAGEAAFQARGLPRLQRLSARPSRCRVSRVVMRGLVSERSRRPERAGGSRGGGAHRGSLDGHRCRRKPRGRRATLAGSRPYRSTCCPPPPVRPAPTRPMGCSQPGDPPAAAGRRDVQARRVAGARRGLRQPRRDPPRLLRRGQLRRLLRRRARQPDGHRGLCRIFITGDSRDGMPVHPGSRARRSAEYARRHRYRAPAAGANHGRGARGPTWSPGSAGWFSGSTTSRSSTSCATYSPGVARSNDFRLRRPLYA